MKAAIVVFLIIGFSSCKEQIDPRLLTGTWKTSNETDHSTGVITFMDNGSITAKTLSYGRLVSEVSGTYKLDAETRVLTTSYGDSISYSLEIKKLTESHLELYYMKTKQTQKYSR